MLAQLEAISPCSSLLIIFGIGDGQLVRACCEDPIIRQKDIWIIGYGETPPEVAIPDRTRIVQVDSWEAMQQWILASFGDHQEIVRLGGADLVEADGLDERAATLRGDLRERTLAMLADRPWALGNDINDTFTGLWHASLNARLLLPAPSLGQVCGSFGSTPAIAVGAGPSVATHLEELRALQDRCLIVACDSVCPGLVKEGIIPHVVTPLERSRQQAQFVACLKDTRAVFCGIAACHPDTLAPFGERVLYLHALDKLYDWLAPAEHLRCMTGSSTGVLSFYVAASLTRGPVYLVGHDLAKEDGATHWAEAAVAGKAFAAETRNAGGFGANGYEERLIPGNSGKLLTSIMWWDNFRSEIASQAALCQGRVFNVNAHDGKYARIENTLPGPLPSPESLMRFNAPVPQRVNQARYDDWLARTARLADDAQAFIAGMRSLRADIAAMRWQPAHTWDLEPLMGRVTPDSHVSAGNLAAFQYFLRSAIFNEQAYQCQRARTYQGRTQAFWATMQSLDGLADGLAVAVEHLQPLLSKVGKTG